MNTDINLNQAECIKKALNIGKTTYYNICTGTNVEVPWGLGDWLIGTSVILLCIAVALMFIFFLFVMITEL